MSEVGKVKLRNLAELIQPEAKSTILIIDDNSNEKDISTPKRKRQPRNRRTKTATKTDKEIPDIEIPERLSKTTAKKKQKFRIDSNQTLINTYFKSCSKGSRTTPTSTDKENKKQIACCSKNQQETSKRRRLFELSSISDVSRRHKTPKKRSPVRKENSKSVVDCIDLCSSSDDDNELLQKPIDDNSNLTVSAKTALTSTSNQTKQNVNSSILIANRSESPILDSIMKITDSTEEREIEKTELKLTDKKPIETKPRKPRPCPPYKVITGTSFAVDAFQFGQIEGVTHYFLTHFHADHYIGLNGKFSMPLYLSSITAKLVRAFIPIDPKYLNEVEINAPVIVNEIEITAIDANHCPGAVMFVFKFKTGLCILHTGDFRASADMESEPIFWNNDLDIIYLDTTYISKNYAFCHQSESIDKALQIVKDFQDKQENQLKRILYICGSYVIGKEKMWTALAKEYNFKVWTEKNRRKALEAMNIKEFLELLCDDPFSANMHVIAMNKLSYLALNDYFEPFKNNFDALLAIRPSGWEKNSKPQYRGRINLVGIEYSEHSSYEELKRFVQYLKPREVISTVPFSRDLMITSKIPKEWYRYEKLRIAFQPSITSYFKMNIPKKSKTCDLSNSISPSRSNISVVLTEISNEAKYSERSECLSSEKHVYDIPLKKAKITSKQYPRRNKAGSEIYESYTTDTETSQLLEKCPKNEDHEVSLQKNIKWQSSNSTIFEDACRKLTKKNDTEKVLIIRENHDLEKPEIIDNRSPSDCADDWMS